MQGQLAFDVMRQALMVALAISTPLLLTALIVGLVVALFQALTTLQEMTLTFAPKMLAMIGAYWLAMDFMFERLASFFKDVVIAAIVAL